MAVLYAKTDGTLIAFAATSKEEKLFLPSAPANAAFTLRFDDTTNVDVVKGIQTSWSAYTLTGTTLKLHGSKVTLAPDSADFTTQSNIATLLSGARNGNLSNQQMQAVLSLVVAKLRAAGLI